MNQPPSSPWRLGSRRRPLAPLLALLLAASFGCRKDGDEPERTRKGTSPTEPSALALSDGIETLERLALDGVPLAAQEPPFASLADGQPRAPASLPHGALPPVAPRPQPALVACFERWILQLSDAGYAVHHLPAFTVSRHRAREELLVAKAAMGDSAFVLGRHRLYRVYGGENVPSVFDGASLLGPTRLWPDAETLEAVFIQDAREPRLQRFVLSGAGTDFDWDHEDRTLEPFDLRAIDQLADGSWLFTGPLGLSRVFGGQRWTYRLPAAAPVSHLVSVPGAPGAWVVRESGQLGLYGFSPFQLVQRLVVEGTPLIVAADAERLALVARGPEGPWFGYVFAGPTLLARLELPPAAGPRSLCLVPGRPWIAWGDRQELIVYDYLAGTRVR